MATSNIENSGPFGSSTIADGPINPSAPSISSALSNLFSNCLSLTGSRVVVGAVGNVLFKLILINLD